MAVLRGLEVVVALEDHNHMEANKVDMGSSKPI